jgi:Tfp pilus assembly protein PilO
MKRDPRILKWAVMGALALLVLVDVALAAYSYQLSSAVRTPQEELAMQTRQLDVLKADIKRGEAIRSATPAIQKDCDRFEHSLLPESSGYSAVSSELDNIAKQAGAQVETRDFKKKDIANRGMQEVAIDITVNGEYVSVVKFLNGLQRSDNLYAVDGLALASEQNAVAGSGGPIKVSLHMKTYFRAA